MHLSTKLTFPTGTIICSGCEDLAATGLPVTGIVTGELDGPLLSTDTIEELPFPAKLGAGLVEGVLAVERPLS